ncbi:MAG: Nucleotide sugar dehydrogenase [uncultured bacterium]|nr:MAG: Nucleotide sugar dehydrogenase [uncultured bacterium]
MRGKKDIKKIAVIGSGIVGQATGKGMADVGNEVVFFDTNPVIIESLIKEGFYAKHADDLNDGSSNGFDFFMLSVPTPTQNGRINLHFLELALNNLGKAIRNGLKKTIVVLRSTVSPGTTENLLVPVLEKVSGKKAGKDFGVCMNPEFLREVSAKEDFRNPWMVVIGSNDKKAGAELEKLYAPFKSQIAHMSLREAEMMKYAHNLLNATKISFFNEMRIVGNSIGADPDKMFPIVVKSAEAIWNPKYGIKNFGAYGGVCLPKDTVAFFTWASEFLGYKMPVLKGTIQTNELMKAMAEYSDYMEKNETKKVSHEKQTIHHENLVRKNDFGHRIPHGAFSGLPL